MATERERIDAFLSSGRMALIGASTKENDFSRSVMRDLMARGIEVVPVNPGAEEIEGRRAFARVQDVEPKVDAALIMTPASASAGVVGDCAEAGVQWVWLHRGGGPGADSPEAVRLAEERGLEVIAGRCPMMFLGEPELTHGVHRMHRGMVKLSGRYPEPAVPPPVSAPRRIGVALGFGAAVWLLSALALGLFWSSVSPEAGLVARAVVAPVASFALAFAYQRIVRRIEPWALAALFLVTVVALDAAIVAGLFLGTFAQLAEPAATWLPALLLLAAAWIGGRVARTPARPPRPRGHAHA